MTGFHLIGIGGIGMSAIARILIARGEPVSGSDVAVTPLIEQLRREGVRIAIGHEARNVGRAHTVVVSSAIDRRNPEYVAAARRGIPLLHRGEMLARLLNGRRGIAVCGTHGKTTTTAMIHAVLRAGGIDAGLVLGGIDGSLDTNAYDGSSEWFVTEADESDGSFALLDPAIAIVTNIENDHLTSDDELPGLVRAFGEFLGKLPDDGLAIVGSDNPLAGSLTSHDLRAKVVTYGLDSQAVSARAVTFENFGSRFEVRAADERLGSIELRAPGTMNVENALAAVATGHELGVPFAAVARALATFRAVRRRFDVLARDERMTIVDDYAHHPTAVRATIDAARRYHSGELIVAFQPHRYTRTAFLASEFAAALSGADRIYLAPVYAASEPAIPGVSERSIGDALTGLGGRVSYVARVEDLEDRILDEAPRGAMVLMLGAGDITDVAARIAKRLRATALRGAAAANA
ncbi:MAG: UDP-N-acetylmuramate--L-alanine ligase [Candidatus Eremiobacteraeota bacterium]|nr:UDP-N-acetylmuramate--L-alanine ligase [Candidatus Eremiobacteraeota bacterium]MBV8500079.1 UDP-N-acetylmuramate--L-alanine ligase [Candidatus Eremiobacteraeota bacterium]